MVLWLAALLLTPAAPAAAAPVRPYFSLDIYGGGGAEKGLEEDAGRAASALSGPGNSVTVQSEPKGGLGFRAGAMTSVSEGLDVGASAGYVFGPSVDGTLSISGGGLSASIRDEREARFFRFLIEPVLNAKLGENKSFHLAMGAGVARGTVKDRLSCAGSACQLSAAEFSDSWTGFAWELSPYFTVDKMLIGLRLAGFPRFKGNENQSELDWTSAGILAGLRF